MIKFYSINDLGEIVLKNNDKKVKAIAIGALLYLIFPLDAIPDIIPALGLTDDVAVITVAISNLTKHYGFRIKK